MTRFDAGKRQKRLLDVEGSTPQQRAEEGGEAQARSRRCSIAAPMYAENSG